MVNGASAVLITEAIASVEDVASHVEDIFAQVGNQLGRGHAIFQELNDGLRLLSQELSGAKIEGASEALRSIAAKLTGLADALPSERALLGVIGTSAAEASSVLRPLVKQIQMIMIIARSARIEAASFDANQDSFLDFTQEAFNLAKAVQTSIDGCTDDQQRLADAIEVALSRQQDFETRYRAELLSVSANLTSAYSGMQDRQTQSVHLADLTSTSTKRIADAVGSAIVSLQVGDSTRQRLEHICHGLRVATGADTSIVPVDTHDAVSTGTLVCQLQVAQLKSAAAGFDADIGDIDRALKSLIADVTGIISHGNSLYGGQDGDMASFLDAVKQALAQASVLIGTCESSRKSVDEALSVVDDTLAKFRLAIANLSETIVDIILIGMNAGLKAGQLGVKGRAFVVIANELKVTADHISGGAAMLKPILDNVEKSANDLKRQRGEGDSSQIANLEPSIMLALREIEAGNQQLSQLMSRLVQEGGRFESMMTSAQSLLVSLSQRSAAFPAVARRLESANGNPESLSSSDARAVGPVFDDLHARYTMVSERDVHAQFSQRIGLTHELPARQSQERQDDTDDVLFF